ncbi:fimbrial isopeptide formation D2 domain-containing protein [Firmicutes bacterium M10-2]|nr:fimbrial isopeptide formation D2 domain-containing protein [Firmicutes bacterium M10-2]
MKSLKKLLSIFAAFFLVLGLTTGIQANQGTNDNTGTITVTNPIEGKTYSLYQLLKLESYNTDLNAYSYTVVPEWTEFFEQDSIENVYIKFDATHKYVTWIENADVVNFSKLALDYVQTEGVSPTQTKIASTTPLTFNSLNLGYYLLDSSAGALCSLITTNPTVNIVEKNSIPTVDKEVQEDSDQNWGNKNDAQIGDTVNFRAKINIGNNSEGANAGAQNYVLHDTMSNGLTFQEVSKVELVRKTPTGEETTITVDASNYEVKTEGIPTGETFNVEFTKDFCDTLEQNDVIIVYYSAVINENAIVGGEGNPNEVVLEYGDKNDSSNRTEPSETTTYTWPVGIFKYATNNGENSEEGLAGAEFQLKTSASEREEAIKLIDVTKEGSIPTYRIATKAETDPETIINTITTNQDGKFIIEGLNAGTYYLHETKAPNGYNKLAAPIEIIVKSTPVQDDQTKLDYTIQSTGKNDQGNFINADPGMIPGYQTVKVLNTTGTTLPETGGMGTTMLYVVGGILLVGSAVLLVTKKRMGHEG